MNEKTCTNTQHPYARKNLETKDWRCPQCGMLSEHVPIESDMFPILYDLLCRTAIVRQQDLADEGNAKSKERSMRIVRFLNNLHAHTFPDPHHDGSPVEYILGMLAIVAEFATVGVTLDSKKHLSLREDAWQQRRAMRKDWDQPGRWVCHDPVIDFEPDQEEYLRHTIAFMWRFVPSHGTGWYGRDHSAGTGKSQG